MSNSQLIYHRFDIVITAAEDTTFDAWIGAVLRNNLLYATEQVYIYDDDITLFRLSQQFPLSACHPLAKELIDGFPAPYYLYVQHPEAAGITQISAGQTLTFSLILIGNMSKYFLFFMDAINFMCQKGMGVDSKPFVLTEMREVSLFNENQLICRNEKLVSDRLLYSVGMESILSTQSTLPSSGRIRICFESPTCLIKQRKRSDPPGYQEKSNLFPSFYQIVRTAAYRLEKLEALYAVPEDVKGYTRSHEKMEAFLEPAAWLEIEEVSLKRTERQSSRRKNRTDPRIPLAGFTGELTFKGRYKPYFTILKYMEQLGIGHALTYGFGKYKIEQL